MNEKLQSGRTQNLPPPPEWLEESWAAAERNGTAKMSMQKINAEVVKVRAQNRPSKNTSSGSAR